MPATFVSDTAKLGFVARPLLTGKAQAAGTMPVLGAGVWIGEQVLVGTGCRIGDGVILDHQVIVESDVQIGCRTLACYRAHICSEVVAGDDCILGGFIGERSQIDDGARVFGALVHRHPRQWGGWDDDESMTMGPRIREGAFIAFGAVIVGDVTIGTGAYVGANAIVRGDVPARQVVAPGELWRPA